MRLVTVKPNNVKNGLSSGLTWFSKIFSGYTMPWVPSFSTVVKFHDDHHKLFNNNYGVFGWLDRLHGTLAPPVEEKMD